MLKYILLLIGFAALIKGADIFVDSSSRIAKRFGIPSIIIGMTIVAMGTSAPELSVSVQSSLAGMNDMSIANVVGSNVFNLLIGLGVCSFFNKLKIINYKDIFILLGTCLALLILSINGVLSLMDGIILLIAFAYYIYNMIRKRDKSAQDECFSAKTSFKFWYCMFLYTKF